MRELLAYSKGSVFEEKLTLRIKANSSGDIYIPTAGYSTEGTQNCDYNWKVSIDGGNETNYNGIGSSSGKIRVGYGLNPLSVHTVTIRPIEEEYGWLRAFGYKGTDIASSLINIISDKSYKGYAVSDKFTGDYFKAYQYYGCNNLVNTDEELLPDTLQIIGDYYRYYEYAGCSSLVSNADEKILKTVKVIGDNYRAYQYENCVGINKINMRAINWASVGNNYRLNQYSGIATDRKPADIYIEGGIEEGGSWGLENDKVKGIYVYEGLVSDYQAKLSTITSSKIKKNAEWDNFEYEFIEYIALADSTGKIRIPVGGFSTSFTQDCAYDWMVSIDGGEAEEISGTGGQTYVSVGSDLVEGNEYRVVIKPKTVSYGWGRAFGFHTTGAQAYIKEIIHDSYKCYASSRTDTGAHYKHGIFTGCVNLINSYEKLPTSVTTIGDYYMKECYAGCTGLKTAFWEIMHTTANIGVDYRYHEYTGCSAMEEHQGIAGYSGTYPTNYKYEYLSGAGNNMDVYITRYEVLSDTTTNALGLSDNNLDGVYVPVWQLADIVSNSYWNNLSRNKFKVYFYDYECLPAVDISKYTHLVGTYTTPNFWFTNNERYEFRYMFDGEHTGLAVNGETNNEMWLAGQRIDRDNGRVYGALLKTRWTGVELIATRDYINTGGGSEFNGTVNGAYGDEKGNIMFAYTRRRSSGGGYYPYRCYTGRGTDEVNENTSGYQTALCAGRDGKFVFWYGKEYYTPTRWGSSSVQIGTYTGSYTGMDFSDDGMTVYLSSNQGAITQYTVASPRNLSDGITSTGKTLNISGSWGLTKDKKYLYVYNGSLSVYTYEE